MWSYFLKSFKVNLVASTYLEEQFQAWRLNNLKGRSREIWWKIYYVVVWHLWKERNSITFSRRAKEMEETTMLIKQTLVLRFFDKGVVKKNPIS